MSRTFLNPAYLEDVQEFEPFVTPFPILTMEEDDE
jgi:hypothetical protein